MSDITTVRCPECGAPAGRFCSRCGALARRRPADAEVDPPEVNGGPSPDEPVPSTPAASEIPQVRRPRTPLVVAVTVLALFGAVAIALSRQVPEHVTATGPRGHWTGTGVTSDRAVTDLSRILWERDLDAGVGGGSQPSRVTELGDSWILSGDRLAAVDPSSLTVTWALPAHGEGDGAITPDGITVVTRDELLTVAPTDGAIVRRTPVSPPLSTPSGAQVPTVVGDVAIAVGELGVAALDRNSGERLWTHRGEDRWVTLLAVADDLALVGAEGGRLDALDVRTGDRRWQARLPAGGGFGNDWVRIVGDTVAVTTGEPSSGALVGLDLDSGEERWRRQDDRHREFVLERDGRLLTRPLEPVSDSQLEWLDPVTGSLEPVGPDPIGGPFDGQSRFLTPEDVLATSQTGLNRVVRGEAVWTYAGETWQQPLVHDGHVFTGTTHGVAVLDLGSGEELTVLEVPQRWTGPVSMSGGLVAAPVGDGVVLDLRTGEPVEFDEPGGWLGPGGVLAPWGVLQRGDHGALVAFDHSGEERWRWDPEVENAQFRDVGLIAALDDVVLLYELMTPDGQGVPEPRLVVLDAETGEEVSSEDGAPAPASVVSDGHSLFAQEWAFDPSREPALVRLDIHPDSHALEVAWRVHGGSGSMILAGDELLDVGSSTVTVRSIDDGSVIRRFELPSFVAGPPVLDDGTLVFDDGHRRIQAVDLSGAPRWIRRTDAPVIADLVAAGNRLYAATARGEIEVFDVGSGERLAVTPVDADGARSASLVVGRGVVISVFDDTIRALGGPDGITGGPDRSESTETATRPRPRSDGLQVSRLVIRDGDPAPAPPG